MQQHEQCRPRAEPMDALAVDWHMRRSGTRGDSGKTELQFGPRLHLGLASEASLQFASPPWKRRSEWWRISRRVRPLEAPLAVAAGEALDEVLGVNPSLFSPIVTKSSRPGRVDCRPSVFNFPNRTASARTVKSRRRLASFNLLTAAQSSSAWLSTTQQSGWSEQRLSDCTRPPRPRMDARQKNSSTGVSDDTLQIRDCEDPGQPYPMAN